MIDRTRGAPVEDLVREAIRSDSLRTHTMLPGRIVSYDETTQTATVAPELLREARTEAGFLEAEAVPHIEGAPVVFPRGGGLVLTFPVAAGDKCLIMFAERDISGWRQLGTEVVPVDARRHSYSDAIVLLGLSTQVDPIVPTPSTTAASLRKDDAIEGVYVTAAGGVLILGGTGPVQVARGANELLQILSVALNLIATSTVGGSPLSNAAAITVEQLKLDVMRL